MKTLPESPGTTPLPSIPSRSYTFASRWQWLVLELCTTLIGPSLSSQASKHTDAWTEARFLHLPVGRAIWKMPSSFLPLKPWPREVQGPGRMSSEQFLGFHPQSRKGPLTPAAGEKIVFSFLFLKALVCSSSGVGTLGPSLTEVKG